MKKVTETTWHDLTSEADFSRSRKIRASQYEEIKEPIAEQEELQKKGWELVKPLKKHYGQFRREKRFSDKFEDLVWSTFAALGFRTLNKSRNFVMVYGEGFQQQIDVFAADEECVIIVECKSTETSQPSNFKKPIEALIGQKEGLTKEALRQFPGRRVKFVWALSNFYLSPADRDRLTNGDIECFTEDSLKYFRDLAGHLGPCAKYQLFARLFANTPIAHFDPMVPAIKSSLGDHTCFTFAIEPERLLKLSYILHHHSANDDLMPAYQRLIKKQRLTGIRRFIQNKGFFPNSLIISINTRERQLRFDPFKSDSKKAVAGILHLPTKYSSAYVIDGQHRLYAYSGLGSANQDTIPVVAFVDLDQHEQLKMFMDINQNQKAVPKSLRVTLNADMLWDSQNKKEQRLAIASKIAQRLEDNRRSALNGRIIVGEDEPSPKRKVTVAAIQDAILKSGFLNTYNATGAVLISEGILDTGESDKTASKLYDFLDLCFDHIKSCAKEPWEQTDDDSTILVTNRGIQALIRVFADIVIHLQTSQALDKLPKELSPEDLAEEVTPYLDPLCSFFEQTSLDARKDLRASYGCGADTKFWRAFQKVINDRYSKFAPEGLNKYLRDETKQFNKQTEDQIEAIESKVKAIVHSSLLSNLGSEDAQLRAFPKKVYTRISKQMADFKYVHRNEKCECDLQQFIALGDCKGLITMPEYWNSLFAATFSHPDVKSTEGKKKKIEWIDRISAISEKLKKSKGYSVPKDDADYVARVYDWLCK